MKKILTISKYLFIESIRDKLFLALLLISIIIVAGNFALNFFEQGIQNRIIFDFGSSLASLLGAFLCIYLVTTNVRFQIDSKQAYFILSSETSRDQFIIGKWLGAMMFIIFNLFIIFTEIFLIIYFNSNVISIISIIYFYITILKLSILCSITMFFNITSTLVVAPTISLFLYFIGHWGNYIAYAVAKSSNNYYLVKIIEIMSTYILPNFKYFTAEHVATENFNGAITYILLLTVYTLALNIILLWGSIYVFKKQDI